MRRKGNSAALALLLAAALLAPHAAAVASAQTPAPEKFELTVDGIMRGPDVVGYAPVSVYWSRDGARVYFRWKRAGEPRLKEPDLYTVGRDGAGLRKLSEEEARQAPPASGDLSKDKTRTVFVEDGDVFLYDHARGERRQVTRTVDAETNARFTRDGRSVYFTRQNNLYLLSLDTGALEQLTDIRSGGGGGGAPPRGTESQEYVKREERELLGVVDERAEYRQQQEAKRRQRERRRTFPVPTGQTVNLTLSPDGRTVVAAVTEQGGGARTTIVPSYVTESAYTEDIPSRTKVGDTQGRTRIALISVETGEAKWVDHGQRAEVAPTVRARTEANATEEASRESGAAEAQQTQGQQSSQQQQQQTAQQQTAQQTQGQQQTQTQGQQTQGQQGAQAPRPPAQTQQSQQTETTQSSPTRDRDVQLFQLQWSEDGTRAALLARAADNKDRWVLLLDPATAKTRVLARIHDDAWVGGPGSFTLGWLADNRTVYFQSERDGFSHLYAASAEGGEPRQLTSGQFEVSDVRLSEDKTKFFFTSSEGSPFERHLYTMPVAGGARTRLTSMSGNNQTEVSPDEKSLAVIRSYSNRPPELYVAPLRAGAEAKQVTTSPRPDWLAHNWIEPPIVSIKARDGATIHARIYKPANYRRGGPAVMFVHGAGYLQNVHKWWSTYYREYMFHHLLMERGFLVLDIDYRGSAGYGRDWRTGIYRHMGGKDLTDHVDAARYLVAEHGVDPKRVGIYGGSYGGFITFMAMFTEPDVFAAGAALRPVTDWAHYNHPYTSNILNTPQADPEAYKRSSPIYFAEGLKGALLICHGMVDVNVHFQDTVRLVQRLIELRKENWELAVYPVEDHSFERADSWADEYKRILKLFTDNLQPDAGPTPAGGPSNPRVR
ncbi:MAG TPA: prolyl oligopeptidase family serine peptidase [Pyrinomonadaceae bacterium]|nr:prolyl oligopeptidase family serine peptidase [Pyrinomonadaceae bacterium]